MLYKIKKNHPILETISIIIVILLSLSPSIGIFNRETFHKVVFIESTLKITLMIVGSALSLLKARNQTDVIRVSVFIFLVALSGLLGLILINT